MSEIHLSVSSTKSLFFSRFTVEMIWTIFSMESEYNSHPCLLEELAVFSRSMVDNVLHIQTHGKKDEVAAAIDKT